MTDERREGAFRNIKSYVLRGGRVSKGQQRAVDTLYTRYCIPYRENELDIRDLGGTSPGIDVPQEIVVEIGFGMGDATARIAERNPTIRYLGIEVFLAGVGALIGELERRELDNVRIIRHDAVDVVRTMIPDGWVSGFHVFFPDPWPKKKHHKRRLIQPEFAALLCRKLKEGGYVYAVTDWEEYAESMLGVLSGTPGLSNPHEAVGPSGYAPPFSWRPRTKFERKGLDKDHRIRELYFTKDCCAPV